jgi:hypothetical protein
MNDLKSTAKLLTNWVELQFDLKKIPGEKGPCFMVTVDGMFKGYVTKEKSGDYGQLMSSNFADAELFIINEELRKISH